MRLLGLDVGDVRIGVAVSDPTGTVVEPLTTIKGREPGRGDRKDSGVGGTGRSWGGGGGYAGFAGWGGRATSAEDTNVYVDLLAERISQPVRMWDESYSSLAADKIMGESGVGRRKKKGKRDSVAAAVILREYLQGTRSTWLAPQPVDIL